MKGDVMEKNCVSKAKTAISITKKDLKKAKKKAKKEAKKAEKRERKDIKSAYIKALRKGNTDKMLAIFAIFLTALPIVTQVIVDATDNKKKD